MAHFDRLQPILLLPIHHNLTQEYRTVVVSYGANLILLKINNNHKYNFKFLTETVLHHFGNDERFLEEYLTHK